MSIKDALGHGGPFAAMAEFPQFVAWTVKTRETGENYKVTVHPLAGYNIDSQDPANWMTAGEACALLDSPSEHIKGIGFVFTKQDPFIFVDIDKCDIGGAWSPVANDLLSTLSGAAVEVSQSGSGLHIFGKCAEMAHACKNKDTGTECYSSGRFVALTGLQASGDASMDITMPMVDVIGRYFPVRADVRDVDWAHAATHPGWAGPEDDEELIKTACASKSASGVFGSSITFEQLWTCDEDALTKFFPDVYSGTKAWDASGVDGALAMHLAFYTGGNHERIKRLMEMTDHVRAKWDRLDGYLEPTIIGAVNKQNDAYYNSKYDPKRDVENSPEVAALLASVAEPQLDPWGAHDLPAGASVSAPSVEIVEPSSVISGSRFMPIMDQIEHFKNCVYVRSLHRIMTPDGTMLDQGPFRATYGGYNFAVDSLNDKTTKSAWEAFTESQGYDFPQADTVAFKPDMPPGCVIQDVGFTAVNTYCPPKIASTPGDVSAFLEHIRRMLPNKRDQEILLAYSACVVQHKGHKSQWAPLLQGVEGNGKSLISRCLSEAIGRKYVHMPKASEIDSKFNGWMLGRLLICVEDIYIPGNRQGVMEAIKPMITGYEGQEIQLKGKDQITADVCCNFIFNSNHKDAIRKTKNDRRFCLMYTAQQEAEHLHRDGMTGDYFPDLYKWLRNEGGYANVTYFLENYDIPAELDFTKDCQRAPVSSSTEEAISASMGVIEQEVLEAVAEGRVGFRGGWVSSIHLSELLDSKRLSSRLPNCKRGAMLAELGYVPHPGLTGGRVNSTVACDGGRPRLYILGSMQLRESTPAAIAAEYEAAQSGA